MKIKHRILITADEIRFAKALACNDKKLREHALKQLKKWLLAKSQESLEFTEEGFMRLWKGLFYCVWMSDKPLVQEETVESISLLIHCFNSFETSMMFIRCFYQSISQAWFGLDQHRLDKFMMLVRRFLRQSLELVRKFCWSEFRVQEFCSGFLKAISAAPFGLVLHLSDIYLEELAKVGREELNSETIILFLTPWIDFASKHSDQRILKSVQNIFLNLIRQTDEGIKHRMKFESWKQLGFPGGDLDLMEEVEAESSEDEGDEQNEVLSENGESFDARAGRVDAILPSLEFNSASVAKFLESFMACQETTTRARKLIRALVNKFTKLDSGYYPLGIRKFEIVEEEDEAAAIEHAAKDLISFDIKNLEYSGSLKKLKKRSDEKLSRFRSTHSVKKRRSIQTWDVSDLDEKSITQSSSSESPRLTATWMVDEISGPLDVTKLKEKNDDANERLQENGDEQNFNTPNKNLTKRKRGITGDSNSIGDYEQMDQKESSKEVVLRIRRQGNRKLVSPDRSSRKKTRASHGSGKKVAFVLSKNCSQGPDEYVRSVESSPTIPFDADKKPSQSVLKPTNIPSPINPFYKKRLKNKLF